MTVKTITTVFLIALAIFVFKNLSVEMLIELILAVFVVELFSVKGR